MINHIKMWVVWPMVVAVLLSGCAFIDAWGESFNREWRGVTAVMTTWNEEGLLIDRIEGHSFQVSRDTRFDTNSSDGTSNKDSSVLLISLGDNHVSHVGSSMILEERGLNNILTETNTRVDISDTEPGIPWLNDFIEVNRNMWQGKAKTLMIRSQDGTPIAVYSGNEVEIFSTDVPKSTWFRVDGKMLLVYRVDYTIVDTDLLR